MESLTSNSSFKPVSSQRSGIAIKSLTFIGFDLFPFWDLRLMGSLNDPFDVP